MIARGLASRTRRPPECIRTIQINRGRACVIGPLIDPFPAAFTILQSCPSLGGVVFCAGRRIVVFRRTMRLPIYPAVAAAALVASTFPAVFTRRSCGNRSRSLHPVQPMSTTWKRHPTKKTDPPSANTAPCAGQRPWLSTL